MATAEEEFSFPATTTGSPPRFLDSPPLWRCSPSPASCPEISKGKEEDEEDRFNALRSFKANKRVNSKSHDEDQEEKMDMLWEDLNDESARSCGKTPQNLDISSPGREVQINCVQALKLSKTNGHMISCKNPNILVFIRALKKVFLMHNSRRTIKKRSW